MTFSTMGRVLAFLMIVFAVLRVTMGFIVASIGTPEAAARYLGSRSSGGAIDQGLILLALGIVVGVLTDISRSVRKQAP